MAYGLARVRNLSADKLKATSTHNRREFEEYGLKVPDHIRTNGPASIFGSNSHDLFGGETLENAVNNRLSSLGITPRKNSVVAIEYVVGLVGTPQEILEAYKNYDVRTFLQSRLGHEFIGKKHGIDNIVSIDLHFDETTPHAHIVVVPIVEKEVKWKNAKGSGSRTEHRLCAKDFTGHKDKLRELQTDIYQFIDRYSHKLGVKVWRGTKKEEQERVYTKATNHELGEIRNEIHNLTDQLNMIINKAELTLDDRKEVERIKTQANEKKAEFEKKKADLEIRQGEDGRIIELHKKLLGKDEKWKQGKGQVKDIDRGI